MKKVAKLIAMIIDVPAIVAILPGSSTIAAVLTPCGTSVASTQMRARRKVVELDVTGCDYGLVENMGLVK
jgi:hypothetical protein